VLIRELHGLHAKETTADGREVCTHCIDGQSFMAWPCPTMRLVHRYEGHAT
jgi:hypothetical protein